MFMGEIENMTTSKRTWVNGYDSFKIYDVEKYCTGKPHESALRSFEVSILGLPPEKKQKK